VLDMEIGPVLTCIVLNARRVRRDGAEIAETNDFHGTQRMMLKETLAASTAMLVAAIARATEPKGSLI
jgi:hypothetical protein